jgi:hypothetical protein
MTAHEPMLTRERVSYALMNAFEWDEAMIGTDSWNAAVDRIIAAMRPDAEAFGKALSLYAVAVVKDYVDGDHGDCSPTFAEMDAAAVERARQAEGAGE